MRLRPAILALAALLAACVPARRPPVTAPPVPTPPVVTPAVPPPPANALAAGIVEAQLPSELLQASEAVAAFRSSCPSLLRRTDRSGLTRQEEWREACTAAATASDAAAFFRAYLVPVRVGAGSAFITGYYEPEIAGSRSYGAPFTVPVYRKPDDLVEADVPNCAPDAQVTGQACPTVKRRGRLVDGVLQPYFDRGEIEDGALAGRGLEIAWAADPIELFFLEVQGSGRLRLPDGSVLRIGYAGQNGLPYTGIGKLMRDRGLLGPGQTNMDGIVAWLRANPDKGRAIMRENRSYVFFRELTGPGPLGALTLPVSPRVTVAADPAFVPLGAPVLLATDRPEVQGLWVAQDTGGAIKGANRFDTFWGAGPEARRIAGGMQARGAALVLLPRSSVLRLRAAPSDAQARR